MNVLKHGNSQANELATKWRRDAIIDCGREVEGNRWATIRYALDSNSRTVRLCAITLVTGAPPAVITLLLGLHR